MNTSSIVYTIVGVFYVHGRTTLTRLEIGDGEN